ncbi:MAG: hypothetical protein H0Z40_09210 [Desulfotomaculum sp.]|nr:hypothetical protein [Desulfotomaculum sp.]
MINLTFKKNRFKNRKKIKMLLYLDYGLQVSSEVIIGPKDKQIVITFRNGKYVMDKMDGKGFKSYERLKHLVNDIDEVNLNYLDSVIF